MDNNRFLDDTSEYKKIKHKECFEILGKYEIDNKTYVKDNGEFKEIITHRDGLVTFDDGLYNYIDNFDLCKYDVYIKR